MVLTPSDVVGSWCGQAGDFLTILDDETFFLDQMSASLYEPIIERLYPPGNFDRPKTKDPTSATGNWYLLELQNIQRLKLSVDKIDTEVVSFNITLIGSEVDGEVALLFYPSDPDLGYADKFTRCEEPQPGAPADSAAVE